MRKSFPSMGFCIITLVLMIIMITYREDTATGSVLFILHNKVPIENENLPTSPDTSDYPKSMYLNKGDKVRIIHDPLYEYSVDKNNVQIRTKTPFRKVEVEILTGPYKGTIGYVERINMSKNETK